MDDKVKIAPVYLVWDGEMILNANIENSWRHVFNYPSWQNYSSVDLVSGEAGKEGEVTILRKDEEGFTFPPYCARTIFLQPGKKVIWKTYPADGDGDYFSGFIDFRLFDLGEKTRFCYHTIYEFLVTYEHEIELERFKASQYENFGKLFDSILPKLQSLVESEQKLNLSRG